jgi:hypothetical protein
MNKFILILLLSTGFTLSLSAQFFSAPKWDYLWDQKAHEKGQIHFSYGYGQPRLDKKLLIIRKIQSISG